jgi:hypothetical protein
MALVAAVCVLLLIVFIGHHRGPSELSGSLTGEFLRWLGIFMPSAGGAIAIIALTGLERDRAYPGLITGTVLILLFTYLIAASQISLATR